tara:strand:+ start:438 stop:692 length:255 start_codon:yes stop_codon:yes gene_type:complete
MRYYRPEEEEYYTLYDKLNEYEYIHYYITEHPSKNKVDRQIIEIEIDGEKVCRLPLVVLCCNYLFHEKITEISGPFTKLGDKHE